jgi:hypothetical protein
VVPACLDILLTADRAVLAVAAVLRATDKLVGNSLRVAVEVPLLLRASKT